MNNKQSNASLATRIKACRDWWLSLTQPGEKEWSMLATSARDWMKDKDCPRKVGVLPALAEFDSYKWIWALQILDEVIERLDPAPVLGECTEPEELEAMKLKLTENNE